MKIGYITDLHITSSISDLFSESKSDLYGDTINFFIQNCITHAVDAVIIGGDILDKNGLSSIHDINLSATLIAKISSNFDTHIILGNHEKYDKSHKVNLLSYLGNINNVTVHDTPSTLIIADNEIGLLPYSYPKDYDDITTLVTSSSKVKTWFSHLDLMGHTFKSKHIASTGYNVVDLLNTNNVLINGHYHNRSKYELEGLHIYHPGSPYCRDFGDGNDVRGVTIFTLEDNVLKNSEFLPNPYNKEYLTVRSEEDMKSLLTNDRIAEIRYSEDLDISAIQEVLDEHSSKVIKKQVVLPEVLNNEDISLEESIVGYLDRLTTELSKDKLLTLAKSCIS